MTSRTLSTAMLRRRLYSTIKPAAYTKPTAVRKTYHAPSSPNTASTSSSYAAKHVSPKVTEDDTLSTLEDSQDSSPLIHALGVKYNDKFGTTLDDFPRLSSGSGSGTPDEIDWTTSYHGIGSSPFPERTQQALVKKIDPKDVEVKPDGIIYFPEIKYRRILNDAFGAGAWGLVPRSATVVTSKAVTREYGLICLGQLVSVARGEQDYFKEEGIATATEGCKSNALMRCCKDLGIASELWDPVFIQKFKKEFLDEKFVEHATTKRKRKMWRRKDRRFEYPFIET